MASKVEKVYTIIWADGTVRGTVSKAIVRAAMEKLGGEIVSITVDARPVETPRKSPPAGKAKRGKVEYFLNPVNSQVFYRLQNRKVVLFHPDRPLGENSGMSVAYMRREMERITANRATSIKNGWTKPRYNHANSHAKYPTKPASVGGRKGGKHK